jgi:hypothetical protein
MDAGAMNSARLLETEMFIMSMIDGEVYIRMASHPSLNGVDNWLVQLYYVKSATASHMDHRARRGHIAARMHACTHAKWRLLATA